MEFYFFHLVHNRRAAQLMKSQFFVIFYFDFSISDKTKKDDDTEDDDADEDGDDAGEDEKVRTSNSH